MLEKFLKILIFVLLVVLISFIAFLFAQPALADSTSSPLYMYIKSGAAGLDFYCASSPVYEDLAQQSETEYTPFALHPEAIQLKAQVIQVSDCNLDNIYQNGGGYLFVWRFTERVTDGQAANRHFTRGAAWIRLLDFSEFGD